MARQLWHLAIADLLSSIGHLAWFGLAVLWVSFGIGENDSRKQMFNTVCTFAMYSNIPFMASVLLEVHIALATASVATRLYSCMGALSCALPLVWLFSVPLGILVVGLHPAHWDSEGGQCNTASLKGQRFKSIVVMIALVLSLVSYGAGAASIQYATTGSVQKRAWRRSRLFVAAAVVTWLPFMVFDFAYQPHQGALVTDSNKAVYYVAYGFLQSNGAINALVYAVQSRLVRQTRRRAQRGLGSDERQAAFGVAFRSFTEVVDIAPLTEQANRTAEHMTSAIEAEHDMANDDEDLLGVFEREDTTDTHFQLSDVRSVFNHPQPPAPP